MQEVYIIGIGQTPIGELWDRSLRDLAREALRMAVQDAGVDVPDALFVANMLAPRLSSQAHLGALVADYTGWRGIEATTVEAACASGGAAFQAAVRAVASGLVRVAAVCGVEKMTDATTGPVTSALATAADADFEGMHGASFVALNALVMQRYMYEYDVPHSAFAPFSLNAHANAANNPNAMFRRPISEQVYYNAPMIADPINLFDSSPICDGAAALIVASADVARQFNGAARVKVRASATATDSLDLAGRRDMLALEAARLSASRAYKQAHMQPDDIDLFEVHDAFTIMAALSLEAAGFAERGRGTHLAAEGAIRIGGRIPISTMGGLKGRGHPVGATGVYELVDAVTQLRGAAGANQIADASVAMTQNIGGTGATVITHILERVG